MPTENEIRVMTLLSAIELTSDAGSVVEKWGNEAVTVLCETALGTYSGIRRKVRTNAVAMLGGMKHPQAHETVLMLLNDDNPDISIRAMRAAGEQQNDAAVATLKTLMHSRDLSPLLAAEVVKALKAIDSPDAQTALQDYTNASGDEFPHRVHPLVLDCLSRRRGQADRT